MPDRRRSIQAASVGSLLVEAAPPGLAADDRDVAACQRWGQVAERQSDLPPRLLLSIGVVESGRLNPATGRPAPWPWTINANGVGQVFESLVDAVTAAQAPRARGVTSIDVGFQINRASTRRLLPTLRKRSIRQRTRPIPLASCQRCTPGSAVGRAPRLPMIPRPPALGGPYRATVLAAWAQPAVAPVVTVRPAVAPVVAARPVATAFVWTPVADITTVRIWRPDAPGLAAAVISIRRSPEPGQPAAVTALIVPPLHYGRFATPGDHSN